MCKQKPAADGTISSSRASILALPTDRPEWHDSRDHDIRTNALNLMAAKMELDADLGYWRTVTPSYSSYEFTKSDPSGAIDKDNSAAAKALRGQFFPNVRVAHEDSTDDAAHRQDRRRGREGDQGERHRARCPHADDRLVGDARSDQQCAYRRR